MGGSSINLDMFTLVYEGLSPDDHPSSEVGRTRDLSLKDDVNAAFIRYRIFMHWTNMVRMVRLPWEDRPTSDSVILGPDSTMDLSFKLGLYEDEDVTFSVHLKLSESNRISGWLSLQTKAWESQSVTFDDMRDVDSDRIADLVVDEWIVTKVMGS